MLTDYSNTFVCREDYCKELVNYESPIHEGAVWPLPGEKTLPTHIIGSTDLTCPRGHTKTYTVRTPIKGRVPPQSPEIRRYKVTLGLVNAFLEYKEAILELSAYDAQDAVFQASLKPAMHVKLNPSSEFRIVRVEPAPPNSPHELPSEISTW